MRLQRAFAVAILLFMPAAGCRRGSIQPAGGRTRSAQPPAAVAGQDRLIVDSAERHYAESIALAQLVEKRTSREAVRAFARDLIADAQREAAASRSLHDRLGASDHVAGWVASQDFQRIASLEGAQFESAFASEIKKDLQDGLEIGTDAAAHAKSPDVRILGQHLVDHDRKYLGRLKELEPSVNR